MKTFLTNLLLGLLLSGSCLTSCTKTATGTTGPAGAQGATGASSSFKTSAITGYVDVFDQFGNADSTFAGVTVSTLKGDTLVSSATDSTGKFSLPSLSVGSYIILFKKTGYDSLEAYVEHSAGDEDKFIGITNIYGSQTTQVTGSNYSFMAGTSPADSSLSLIIYFNGPAQSPDADRNFNFYFSRSKNVSNTVYDAADTNISFTTYSNQLNILYDLQNFGSASQNYNQGDTIYIRTYVTPLPRLMTSWFNYSTYQTIPYPYTGSSSLQYFIWPL